MVGVVLVELQQTPLTVTAAPPSEVTAPPADEEVVVVYDTGSDGWRSFRVDSVLDFESL